MKLTFHRYALPLEHEFTIARGSISEQRTLVVELSSGEVSGLGEATDNAFYGHSIESMVAALSRCEDWLASHQFETPEQLWQDLQPWLGDDSFALSAIDLAAHDLYGKLQGKPSYAANGLQWEDIPDSSYTIGIDAIDRMVSKLSERPGWPIYKIKLGTPQDVEIVRALREHTHATFRVDANCGWTVEETIENSRHLEKLNVEFIEQPLPNEAARSEHEAVYAGSALPIVADESCQSEADVDRCQGAFHGINVKLCKCGGLTPAIRMLRQARSLGMKTMVGCMVESSVGISAAAQLLPLLDYADLDGSILIAKDPAVGAIVDRGRIQLGSGHGNGIALNPALAVELCCQDDPSQVSEPK